jgi:hypothetical protein
MVSAREQPLRLMQVLYGNKGTPPRTSDTEQAWVGSMASTTSSASSVSHTEPMVRAALMATSMMRVRRLLPKASL